MEVLDLQGGQFNELAFIKIYRAAVKLAPTRYMQLRMHPDRYTDLGRMAQMPEHIQIGSVPAPLGRSVMRVCSMQVPNGVPNGIEIIQDEKFPADEIQLEIHRVPAMRVVNIRIGVTNAATTQSPKRLGATKVKPVIQ